MESWLTFPFCFLEPSQHQILSSPDHLRVVPTRECQETSFFTFFHSLTHSSSSFYPILHIATKQYLHCQSSRLTSQPECFFHTKTLSCAKHSTSLLFSFFPSEPVPFTTSTSLSSVFTYHNTSSRSTATNHNLMHLTQIQPLHDSRLSPPSLYYQAQQSQTKEWLVFACPSFLSFPYFFYSFATRSWLCVQAVHSLRQLKTIQTDNLFLGCLYHPESNKYFCLSDEKWKEYAEQQKDPQSFQLFASSKSMNAYLDSFHSITYQSKSMDRDATFRFWPQPHEAPLWKLDTAGRLILFGHHPKRYLTFDPLSNIFQLASHREDKNMIYALWKRSPNTPDKASEETTVLTRQGEKVTWKEQKHKYQETDYLFEGPYSTWENIKYVVDNEWENSSALIWIALFVWLPMLLVLIVFILLVVYRHRRVATFVKVAF